MSFSRRLDRFGDEIFAALNERKLALEKQGRHIYNMSIGTPDFIAPDHIRRALIESAADPESWKYSLRDLPETKQAVADYYLSRYGVAVSPDQVMSCYGTQEGVGHLCLALCDEGDTVLLPDPCYPVFKAGALLSGAECAWYPLDREHGFVPCLEEIPDDVADRAKVMIVSLPSNPLGSIAPEGFYERLAAFGRKHGIIIVHDNAYSDIIFEGGEGGSFLAAPGALETGVEFFSLSKSFNVTGARISFLIGRRDVVDAVRKLRSQIDFGMFIPIQKAAIAALRGPREQVREQCLRYRARRDALCGGARKIGWNIPDARGSMFVWAPIPDGYTSSMAFCVDLLEKASVLCTPGASFGPHGEGYVRFALVLDEKGIAEALESIRLSGILSAGERSN